MKVWPARDAKARFSELLRASLSKGPQMITLRGREVAVLVSLDEWQHLQHGARPSLKDLLLSKEPRFDLALTDRPRLTTRPVDLDD